MSFNEYEKNYSFYDLIKQALAQWDPVGATSDPEAMAMDEYDAYVPGLINLLKEDCTPDQVFEYLLMIQVDCMGLPRNVCEDNLTQYASGFIYNLKKAHIESRGIS